MFKLFRKKTRAELAEDSWKDADGTYVADFRRQLDWIAKRLVVDSKHDVIYNRFHYGRKCAELFTEAGEVIARVRIRGEMSTPTNAEVTSNISEEYQSSFTLLFPGQPERITFKLFSF